MKSARGFAVLSALAWSVLATCAKAQNNTVYSGSYSESGTRTDCVAGTTTPWSQSGTFTITVSPALTTLATSGGPVTGSFTFSGSDIGCTTQAVSGQGSVTGVVSAGGGVTLILSETSCSITAQGTIDEVSASLPQACLAHTGTGSLDVSSRATPSNSSPTCIPFPSGFIPFSSIYYVTAANGAGDHLVVGTPAPGALATIDNIPLPAFSNQTFCDSQVQLAPQQYYPSVYVPTADESGGNFAAFNGLLVNPVTNQPYPNGVIPPSQLNQVFAWRIAAAQAASGQPNWTATGSLPESMSMQAAVLLPTGKVLVVSSFDTNAFLYDPVAGTFSPAGQMMSNHGSYLTATLLSDGRVLVVGGETQPSAAELYDPVAGQFTLTGSTIQPHGAYHTATLLNDGRVLVVGGLAAAGYPPPAAVPNSGGELFDPQAGTFAPAGPMAVDRAWHTATLLADGRVLVAGGLLVNPANTYTIFDSAEVFDPTIGAFSPTLPMSTNRAAHFAALLPNGEVLVGGGFGGTSVDLFNPVGEVFTPTGSCSNEHNTGIATLLSSGQVLVVGGDGGALGTGTNSAELYSPATGSFTPTGSMTTSRTRLTATLLQDGRVLAAAGDPVCCSPYLASAEIYTPTTQGLVTSQSGLTFQFAQGSSTPTAQTIEVLSNTTTIPWTVSIHTYEGGNWLTTTPTSGNSTPGATLITLSITANPSGLAAQDYYGAVTLTPTDGVHPPVSIAVVLHIVPAGTAAPPVISPTGLVFVGPPGATLSPQTFNITNLTSSAIAFTAAGSTTPKFFSFSPASGTIPAAATATFTVIPNLTGITAGVYNGAIQITFGAGSSQTVALLLVVSATATANARPRASTPPSCTPSKLLPLFTSVGAGFTGPVGWPVAITVDVVDDCGDSINSGNVIVSFTDGDPAIRLLSIGNANWSGTWNPELASSNVTIRADATQSALTGSTSITGQASANPAVPVVFTGGVVSSIDFSSAPSLGLLVSIFGSGLADSTVSGSIPLATQLGATQVILGGQALPLLYASSGVVNVLIPYDLAVNVGDQLVVENGPAVSVPVPTAIFTATPAIISVDGSGTGQGQIYAIAPSGAETLANQNNPASAGQPVVIYCVGLGPVNQTIMAGQPAPGSPLAQATSTVTVTIGGITASAAFAGLTPGETGLYQINATIPTGVPTGNQVPVTISAGAASSSAQIYMAIH